MHCFRSYYDTGQTYFTEGAVYGFPMISGWIHPKLAGYYYRNLPCLREQRYLSDHRFWSSHPSSIISTIVHNCRPYSCVGAMKELAYGTGDRKIAQRHPRGSRCWQAVTFFSRPKLVPRLQSSKMLQFDLSLPVTECLGM